MHILWDIRVCVRVRVCVCVPIHPTSVTISPPSFGNTICFWSFSWPHGYVRGYTSNLWSYMAWYLQCRFLKYHWQLFAGGSRTHRLAGFSWSKPLCSTCGRNACGEFRAKIFSKRKVSGSSLIPNKPGRFIISTGYSNGPLIHLYTQLDHSEYLSGLMKSPFIHLYPLGCCCFSPTESTKIPVWWSLQSARLPPAMWLGSATAESPMLMQFLGP